MPDKTQHVSIPEYARQLGLTRDAVYKRIKRGQINASKVGRNFAVDVKDNEFISIPQYAALLGISRIAVFMRVKKGYIPAEKAGRSYLIPLDYVRGVQGEQTYEKACLVNQTSIKKVKPVKNSYLSIPELAKHLGVTRDTVYKRVIKGTIDAQKVGGSFGVAVKAENYLSLPQDAALLNISRIAMFKRVKQGKIKAIRIGRRYCVEKQLLFIRRAWCVLRRA